tara:strand:+ start:572 stop:793 length:222 start_codon:yes stop_codon:yes gene_type:complete
MSKELNDERIAVYKEAIENKVERLGTIADKIYQKKNLIKESGKLLSNYIVEKEILENEINYLKKYLKSLKVNL